MYAPITHILAGTSFRRERLLPMSGRVLARRGQLVSPIDVVAEAVLNPEHMLLDIARGLGLSAKQADKLLQCKAGDEVGEGDILAGRLGMGRRVVRAPFPGRVMVAGEGQVLLQLDGQPQELKAGYPGLVVDLIGERGVIIETTGALIQGVWGNGRINYGLLSIQTLAPDALLAAEQLDVSLRGTVIFGGICIDERALLAAADEMAHHAGGEVAQDRHHHGIRTAGVRAVVDDQTVQGRFPVHGAQGVSDLLVDGAVLEGGDQNVADALALRCSQD